MRPDSSTFDRMLQIARDADAKANEYPEQFRPFVNHMATTRGMVLSGHRERDWKYQCYEDVVFDLGHPPRKALLALPEEYEVMESKQCYFNCWSMAMDNPDLAYMEGYADAGLLVVRHAWLEDLTGRIIDPTWAGLDKPADLEATYYGVEFDTEFVLRHSSKTGWTSIFESDWKSEHAILRNGFIVSEEGVVQNLAHESTGETDDQRDSDPPVELL